MKLELRGGMKLTRTRQEVAWIEEGGMKLMRGRERDSEWVRESE